jgi:type VI secretion system secreted protein VgrG
MLVAAVSFCCPTALLAGSISLESAQSFAILGGAGIAVGGVCCSIVSGNLGVYPASVSSITGFPASGSLLIGTVFGADNQPLVAAQARTDANAAYTALGALPSSANENGVVLGNGGTISTLLPGVYTFDSSAQVDGTLTLDFNGASNAMFVFQIATTLTTGSGAAIQVTGGNSTDSIYWQVGTSATLGSNTAFAGNILAFDAITLDPGASIACGRALASTGSVTLASADFVSDDCSVDNTIAGYSATGVTDFGSDGFSGGATPEPGTFLLLGMGLTLLAVKYFSPAQVLLQPVHTLPLPRIVPDRAFQVHVSESTPRRES